MNGTCDGIISKWSAGIMVRSLARTHDRTLNIGRERSDGSGRVARNGLGNGE